MKSLPKILYEDKDCFVVEKNNKTLTHPRRKDDSSPSLVSSIRSLIDFPKDDWQAGVAHRLDRDTAGLVLCGKNQQMKKALQLAFKNRRVVKKYFALVNGRIVESAILQNYMLRDVRERMRRKVLDLTDEELQTLSKGKSLPFQKEYKQQDFARNRYSLDKIKNLEAKTARLAITSYNPLVLFAKHTLLDIAIETGRTHQIRAQLAKQGNAVVGDLLYGKREARKHLPREMPAKVFPSSLAKNPSSLAEKELGEKEKEDYKLLQLLQQQLFLYAYHLQFPHPRSDEMILVEGKLPVYFRDALLSLREKDF